MFDLDGDGDSDIFDFIIFDWMTDGLVYLFPKSLFGALLWIFSIAAAFFIWYIES